jgi:chloramphenicol-sensitive protein RarD
MTQQTLTAPAVDDGARRGFFLALSAYLLWGFLPIYMKSLAHVPPIEVLSHRIIWSVPIAAIALLALGQWGGIKAAMRKPKLLLGLTLTAFLITLNWGIYIWAVSNNHALDAALGYFINPLFSIFLGALILHEKLQKIQFVAILSVIIGVSILTWQAGGLPIVGLALTVSWVSMPSCAKRFQLAAQKASSSKSSSCCHLPLAIFFTSIGTAQPISSATMIARPIY